MSARSSRTISCGLLLIFLVVALSACNCFQVAHASYSDFGNNDGCSTKYCNGNTARFAQLEIIHAKEYSEKANDWPKAGNATLKDRLRSLCISRMTYTSQCPTTDEIDILPYFPWNGAVSVIAINNLNADGTKVRRTDLDAAEAAIAMINYKLGSKSGKGECDATLTGTGIGCTATIYGYVPIPVSPYWIDELGEDFQDYDLVCSVFGIMGAVMLVAQLGFAYSHFRSMEFIPFYGMSD